MPDKTIKTTLAIDGEQKYKRAIDDAKASIRNMGTALTLATAEFKKDGDAMKLMQSRAKTLRDEISQQQQIVKSLEGAVKEATTAYGENSQQAEKWQAELNRAKAALAGLELEFSNNEKGLDKNGRSFTQAGKSAEKFGEDVKKAGKTANAVNFLALDKALTNTSNLLSGLLKGIYNVGQAGWGFVTDAASWADDLSTQSLTTGLDVVTLQQWNYAAQIVETDVDTMFKAMDKLQKGGANVESALKALGIQAKDYVWFYDENGAVDIQKNVTPTLDLFWQVVDALGAMGDEEQRNAITQEIFGKSYREMLPLIDKGKEGWDAAANDAKTVSEENVAKLADFADSLTTLNSSFETLKNTFAAELAPSLQTIADTFTKLIGNFQEWAESDAGKEALSKLGGAIESVFTSFANHADFEAIVTGVTGAFQGLTSALDWVSENSGTVAGGLKAILLALVGFKVLGAFTNAIQLINALKGLGGGGSTSTPTAGTPTAGSPSGGQTNTGTETVSTQNTTTENVTTENVTTQNATTQNVTTQNVTTASASTLNATAENVTSSTVQSMVVENMIGGNGGNGLNLNGGNGGNGMEGLPSGSNSFPVLLPGSGTGTSLPSGGAKPGLPDLSGGSGYNLGPGENAIQLDPSDFKIDGEEIVQKAGFGAAAKAALTKAGQWFFNSGLSGATAVLGGGMLGLGLANLIEGGKFELIRGTANDEGEFDAFRQSMPAEFFYDESGNLLEQYWNRGLPDTLVEERLRRGEGAHVSDGSDGRKPTTRHKNPTGVAQAVTPEEKVEADAAQANGVETIKDRILSMIEQTQQEIAEGAARQAAQQAAPVNGWNEIARAAGVNPNSGSEPIFQWLFDQAMDAASPIRTGLDHKTSVALSKMLGDWMSGALLDQSDVKGLMDQIWEQIGDQLQGADGASALPEEMSGIGQQTAQGLADGIDANSDAAVQAAQRMAAAVREAVRGALQIASPSRVMMELGGFVTSGFAQGIDSSVSRVRAAVSRMSAAVTARPVVSYGGAAGTYYGQTYNNSRTMHFGTVNVNTAQDMHDLMAQMDDQNRYERQGMGVM